MCQALQELMKDEIEEKVAVGRNEGRREGRNETKAEAVRNLMETLQFTAEQAMDALKIPESERESLRKKL